MSKWLRWLLLALLIYFVIAYPQSAAELTREIVAGTVALFTGAAEAISQYLRSIT